MPGPRIGQAVADIDPPVGWALLTAQGVPALSLLCELGDTAPTITQGYGGWEEVAIPQGKALTVWRGHRPLGIDLSLMLDQFDEGRDGTSIMDAKQVLEAMAGRGEKRLAGEPPPVKVATNAVMPHDAHTFRDQAWVVNEIDWDESTAILNDHGHWVRIAATVSLLEYVPDQAFANAALKVASKAKPKSKTAGRYITKAHDTLVSIARRKLHDAGRWPEIAKLNPKHRDPRVVLKTGTHLRLP